MTIARELETLRAELYELTNTIEELEAEWKEVDVRSSEYDFYKSYIRRLRDDRARVESKLTQVRHEVIIAGGQCDE